MALSPERPRLNDYVPAQLVGPDGSLLNAPTLMLSLEDAKLLREYKKWLLRNGYREALYCTRCFESNRQDGLHAFVTDQRILFKCRCRSLLYEGQTL